MGPFTTRRRVEFRDTDAAGIAHFSAFLFWMESVEHELLRSAGVPIVDRAADGTDRSWPRVSVSCDYEAAVRFADEVEVAAWVEAVGTSSVTYGFRFTHGTAPVAHGRTVAVHCRMRPGRPPEPEPIPPVIRSRLEPYAAGR